MDFADSSARICSSPQRKLLHRNISLIGHRMIRKRGEKGFYRFSTQRARKWKRNSIEFSPSRTKFQTNL
jgi:hypothetical protein